MHQIVGDTPTMARQGGTVEETDPVSLAGLAEECWEGTETPGATLLVDDDAEVMCDQSRVRELFENLYRNSVEHGSTDSRPEADDIAGETSASSRSPEDSRDSAEHAGPDVTVRVGTVEDDGELRGFYVADDGPGIPPEERDSVFEAEYTTAEEGTGFGLNVVREMARCHGWAVAATESDAGGARFEITGVGTG